MTAPATEDTATCTCGLDQRRQDLLAPLVAIYGTAPVLTRPKGNPRS